jgi:hypothetical protein
MKSTAFTLIVYGGLYALAMAYINYTPKEMFKQSTPLPMEKNTYTKPVKRIKFD